MARRLQRQSKPCHRPLRRRADRRRDVSRKPEGQGVQKHLAGEPVVIALDDRQVLHIHLQALHTLPVTLGLPGYGKVGFFGGFWFSKTVLSKNKLDERVVIKSITLGVARVQEASRLSLPPFLHGALPASRFAVPRHSDRRAAAPPPSGARRAARIRRRIA